MAQGKSGDGPDNVTAAAAYEQQCKQKYNMVQPTKDVAKSLPQVGFEGMSAGFIDVGALLTRCQHPHLVFTG